MLKIRSDSNGYKETRIIFTRMRMMRYPTFLVFAMIMIFFIVSCSFIEGDESLEKKCVIIVSGNEGYTQHELDKASSFREYLLENCSIDDIIYLTDPSDPFSDGAANVSNIEKAFEWLRSESGQMTEVMVYIFDHITMIADEETFQFDDGNIEVDTIELCLEDVECLSMTVILNGERSGLGGPILFDGCRDVICSMGPDQDMDPDLFNITRSLKDPSADLDGDGEVSFIEAYWNEVILLRGAGQDPVLYN